MSLPRVACRVATPSRPDHGVSRYLGGRRATLLAADPGITHVIGVDTVPPRADLGGTEFVRADIRNPLIAKVIASSAVDTVVHMNVVASPSSTGSTTASPALASAALVCATVSAQSLARVNGAEIATMAATLACRP